MPVTIFLIVANVIVFVVYLFKSSFTGLLTYDAPVLFKMGAAFGPNIILQHEYWRLFSCLFLHANGQHIFLNMFSLFIFGRMLEKPMGSARFLVLYLVSGLFGGLTSVALHGQGESVGASGAILGLVGFYFYLQLQMDKKDHPGITYRLRQGIGLACALYGLSLTPGVDNAAHIGGLVAGIICGGIFQKFSDMKVSWCSRDLVITLTMASLTLGALYAEECIFGQDKSLQVAVFLRETADCLQKNDVKGALANLDSAIALDPENTKALFLRSNFNLTLGRYPQALRDINEVLAIKQDDSMAYNERASTYLAMGRYSDALADAKLAVQHDPHSGPAIDTEAMALAYLGQLDQALQAIDRAIEADNGPMGIYLFHRSNIYGALGDSAKASADLAEANKLGFTMENWEHDRPLPKPVAPAS
jgi:rhomboid protease GluP